MEKCGRAAGTRASWAGGVVSSNSARGAAPYAPACHRRGGDESARTWKTVAAQALAIRSNLSHRGGQAVRRGPRCAERILFLHERPANVYENKGTLWKKRDLSRNVYENKGSYSQNAGMYMKIQQLALGVSMSPRELGKRSLCRPLPSVLTCHTAAGRLSAGDLAAQREFFFCTNDPRMSMKTKGRCGKGAT